MIEYLLEDQFTVSPYEEGIWWGYTLGIENSWRLHSQLEYDLVYIVAKTILINKLRGVVMYFRIEY